MSERWFLKDVKKAIIVLLFTFAVGILVAFLGGLIVKYQSPEIFATDLFVIRMTIFTAVQIIAYICIFFSPTTKLYEA